MADLKSEEYSRLCSEIESNSTRINNMLAIVYTAFAAIFGFGLEKGNGFIILCALIPVIPGLYMIASQYNSNNRITTYIKHFYEGKENQIYWERRLTELRTKDEYKSNYNRAISLSFILIGIFSLLFSQIYFWINTTGTSAKQELNSFPAIVFIAFTLLMLIAYIFGFFEISKSKKSITYFEDYWGTKE